MTADLALLLAANACFLLAGIGITGAARWWRSASELVPSLGLAYLAGVAAYGVLAQLLYVLGAPLSRWQVVALCAPLAAGALVPFRRPRPPGPRRRLVRAEAVLLAAVVAMIALLAVDYWFQPLWAYDSWTLWTPKARALAELSGLDAGWFTSTDVISKDYPLLLPAVEAAGFRFTGFETRLLDVQSLLFLAGFAAAFVHLARARAPRPVVWAVLVMICFAPTVAQQLASAEADLPVAFLFAAAGMLAVQWLEDRSRPALALLAVLAAGAVATKVEGLIFVLALFAALLAAGGRTGRFAAATLAAGIAAVAVGLGPWRLWLHVHDVHVQGSLGTLTDVSFLWEHLVRLPQSSAYMVAKIFDPTAWILIAPLAILAGAVAFRAGARRVPLFAVVTVLLALAGLAIAYWSTPIELGYHLSTSARRVVSGPVLFLAAMTPFLARSASDP